MQTANEKQSHLNIRHNKNQRASSVEIERESCVERDFIISTFKRLVYRFNEFEWRCMTVMNRINLLRIPYSVVIVSGDDGGSDCSGDGGYFFVLLCCLCHFLERTISKKIEWNRLNHTWHGRACKAIKCIVRYPCAIYASCDYNLSRWPKQYERHEIEQRAQCWM